MNYRITFQVESPICFQNTIMFDGLVAYAYTQEQLNGIEKQTARIHIKKGELIDFSPMPIKKHKDGYFMASWMFYEQDGAVEYLGSWKKRWANENDHLADFGRNKRKVRVNNASFKSYNMPMRLVDIPEAWFYFQSDDVAEVERLISNHIVGLGKKISQGNGLIESFKIEKLENYKPFSGIVRPIPVGKRMEGVQYLAFKPPYWLPENMGYCKVI